MPVKLRRISPRDLVLVVLPLLVLTFVGFWAAAQFIDPAPPKVLTMSSGGEAGAYQRFALQYKDVLARYGVELRIAPSGGSLDNLKRLRDPGVGVDVAFVQGGTGQAMEGDALESLGDFYYEPLWIFYRSSLAPDGALTRLQDLKGRRVAIGGAGSGTQHLALELLAANGMDNGNTSLVAEGGFELVERLSSGQLDAVLAVGPTQSALVWSLLYTPGIQVMSLLHAEAYTRHFPYLTRLTLPRGGIDLVRDIPSRDLSLLSPMTSLLVRDDTHPALVGLLMQAAGEAHGGAGVFQKPGEFPRRSHGEFPPSKEAERYYKSGKPFLQRYLPFWAATLVDRMIVMLVPLLAVLLPFLRFAPSLYSWRVRSRIYRRYGELKFLESEIQEEPEKHTRSEWLARVDVIESDVNRLTTPLAFADMLYTLRAHIELVRAAVLRIRPD